MSAFVLSPEAYEDIWIIWTYLAQEAGAALADRIEAELFDTFEKLARAPGMGHRREDLTDHPVFFFAAYQYLIVYRKASRLRSPPCFMANGTCSGFSSIAPYNAPPAGHRAVKPGKTWTDRPVLLGRKKGQKIMEVHFAPEQEAQIAKIAAREPFPKRS